MFVKENQSRLGLSNAHQLMCALQDILWLLMRRRRHFR
jgi:hypothetical protein